MRTEINHWSGQWDDMINNYDGHPGIGGVVMLAERGEP